MQPMPQPLDRPSPFKLAWIQTRAMTVDAYRELNSKRLFWLTMLLSAVVVGGFGAVGFDTEGFSVFGKHFNHPFVNTLILPRTQLYKNLFITLGVQTWLGLFGLALALVSTAPIFPDFLSGGAIDLYLARPIGRVRLFLTKYVMGLLFVAIQVMAFCTASFLVIGIRGGAWVPGLFLAVPVVVLLFSYLWSICALVGTLTRSTIAALLVTLLAWFGIFGIHAAESTLLTFSIGTHVEADELGRDVDRFQHDIDVLRENPATTQPKSPQSLRLWTLTRSLEDARDRRAKRDDPYAVWHRVAYAVKWPLPKVAETTKLLERWLDRQFRRNARWDETAADPDEPTRGFFRNPRLQRLTAIEVDKIIRARSATWVIGTSLLFEAMMVGLALRVFVRRDY